MKVSQSQHSEALQHGLNQHQAALGRWDRILDPDPDDVRKIHQH